jgi:hypothetical protein
LRHSQTRPTSERLWLGTTFDPPLPEEVVPNPFCKKAGHMARSFFRKTTAGTIGTGRCPVISLIYTRLEQVWHAKNKRLPALRWRSPPPRHVPSSAPCKRSADRYYDTMSVQELLAELPAALIQSFAAKDCALLFWTTGPQLKQALDILTAWNFTYETVGFNWIKTKLYERHA